MYDKSFCNGLNIRATEQGDAERCEDGGRLPIVRGCRGALPRLRVLGRRSQSFVLSGKEGKSSSPTPAGASIRPQAGEGIRVLSRA